MQTNKFTQAVTELEWWTFYKKSWTKYWFTAMPFSWYLNYEDKEGRITVPENFKTDFGSIPFFLLWAFNPTAYVSYVLHDYLYHTRGRYVNEHGITITLTRKEADDIMQEALIVEWCSKVSAYFQWLGVRLFWWINW